MMKASKRLVRSSRPFCAPFPPVVQLALVSGICPSNCRFCPVGRKNMGELPPPLAAELKPHFFNFDLFKKIVREVAHHPECVLRIHSRGEPMEHPFFFKMIKFAKDCGVNTVTSFTNGIYLRIFVHELLDSHIDLIEVSVDASDPDSYYRCRRTNYFNDVLEGVSKLFAARNSRPTSPTRIVVSAVDHAEFRFKKQEFIKFWHPISDKIIIRPFHTHAGRISDSCNDTRSTVVSSPCVQLWERFSIGPVGFVNSCFSDWGDKELVGDLNKDGASIQKIWTSEIFESIRAESLKGPYLECCRKCSGSSLSSWGRNSYQNWVHKLLQIPYEACV